MPIGFGVYNPFPFSFGGGDSIEEIEHNALLEALKPAFDEIEGSANYAECLAHAQQIAGIWAVNERLKNSRIPSRMLETLPDWEKACKLRVGPTDTDVARRNALSAALRGLSGNTITDIQDACSEVMGPNFVELVFVAPADEVTYWPGINPGYPGFEWMSNRAVVAVKVTSTGMSSSEFFDKRITLADILDRMLPAWMTFTIGTGSSFVVNQGIVGQTFL